MSYDLIAVPVPPDEDFEEGAAELDGDDGLPPTPEERAVMEALAAALHAVHPAAERTDDERWIALDDDALQIGIRKGVVELTMPYRRDGAAARAVLARMLEHAAALRDHGWTVYDPQIDAVIAEHPPQALYDTYVIGRSAVARPAPRRPWWRRLLGR